MIVTAAKLTDEKVAAFHEKMEEFAWEVMINVAGITDVLVPKLLDALIPGYPNFPILRIFKITNQFPENISQMNKNNKG